MRYFWSENKRRKKWRIGRLSEASCVFCGSPHAVVPIVFPSTFTAYQLLQAGDKACPRCAVMFGDPQFRRNCWILKDGKFVVLDDPLRALGSLPEPPFLLYFTKQKRKHGWIVAVQNPVLNLNKFILVVDEEKVLFERAKFEEYFHFSKGLLDKRIPKCVLLGGMPAPSVIKHYCLSWPTCFRLQKLMKEPLWRVCVEFAKGN